MCVLGDAKHCEHAQQIGVENMDVEALKKLNKNKKLIKKLAKKYNVFLVRPGTTNRRKRRAKTRPGRRFVADGRRPRRLPSR